MITKNIPNGFFNLLSSNSNREINAASLLFLWERYEEEITFRIHRDLLRDDYALFLRDNFEQIKTEEQYVHATYSDIATDYLNKFSSQEIGWLEEERDDTTFDRYLIITEQGIQLAELLQHLARPKREEFSSYLFNIYNTLSNRKQWEDDPYALCLSSVYKNAKDLSKSLKKLSTYMKNTIEDLTEKKTLEELTNFLIENENENFIKEYARLIKSQNIHVYRNQILQLLSDLFIDQELLDLIILGCACEEEIEEDEAKYKVDEIYDSIRKFFQEDCIKILKDIRQKSNMYIQIALAKLRINQSITENVRNSAEQILKELVSFEDWDKEVKEELHNICRIQKLYQVDLQSLKPPMKKREIVNEEPETIEMLTQEEIDNFQKEMENSIYDPYTEEKCKKYVEVLMGNRSKIKTEDFPFKNRNDYIFSLYSLLYAEANGYEVKVNDDFFESEHVKMRNYEIKEKEYEF